MKQWLSAAEIAALNLPGVPSTKRNVIKVAARERWLGNATFCRERQGRGGGYEFHFSALPAEARAAYVGAHVEAIEIPASIARDAACEPAAADLSGPSTDARDARLALLSLADRTARDAGISRKQGDRYFADLYNTGQLKVDDWIKTEVKSLTSRTLKRWRAAVKARKTATLAVNRAAARRDAGVLDRAGGGEVKTFLLALLAKQPQLTAHHLRALAAERYPGGVTIDGEWRALPPIRTFQYTIAKWRREYRNELQLIRDPDGFKSKVRFSARVSTPATRLNEFWQIDASPADVLTTDGRHSLYLCEDIYSRRLIGLVTKTPRAAAVGLVLRKAMLAWGVPDRIKTDNGSDFVARETRRLLAALAIEHELAPPFRPETKGHIERAIGTLQRGLMRTLEGFIGHSVADRKTIEARKSFAARLGETPDDLLNVALSAADLQARVDEWCAVNYGHAPHAGLKGQTPFAVAAMAAGGVRRIEDERALDMLLAPVAGKDGQRTVTKSGLRIAGSYYMAGFLGVGDDVHVRMDPADLGRAYVYSADGLTYLGEAIAPELAGIDPQAAIMRVRAEQKALIEERIGPAKREARKIKARDIAPALHRQALAATGKLVEFPKPSQPHDTPALAAARAAAAEPAAPQFDEAVLAMHARLVAEASAPTAQVKKLREEETPHQRWNRARALEAALAQGETIDADELLWLGGYREGPEYRGYRMTYDDAADELQARSKGQ